MLLKKHAMENLPTQSSNFFTTLLSHISKIPPKAPLNPRKHQSTYRHPHKLLTTSAVTNFSLVSCRHTISASQSLISPLIVILLSFSFSSLTFQGSILVFIKQYIVGPFPFLYLCLMSSLYFIINRVSQPL
jgi:hypothetical protein